METIFNEEIWPLKDGLGEKQVSRTSQSKKVQPVLS